MSTFTFRPAQRSHAKPLIGIYSESGCGKTWSSLLVARGFVGPTGRVGMIETESGRGEAYADILPGGYDVLSIRETFSPSIYGDALTAAEQSDLGALIIDSASHEWEGAGGVLAMAAENQERGLKGPLVWQQPKMDHQRHFMLRLMATPIPLVIVCMRAKYPMEEKLRDGRREWARSEALAPKQSEDILYEMFVHGWIDRDHKFHGTKYTRPDLRDVIRDGEAITLETGARLAAWAGGGAQDAAATPSTDPRPAPHVGTRTDILERISAAAIALHPGETDAAKTARLDELEKAFGTRQWSSVKTMAIDLLEDGLRRLQHDKQPAGAGSVRG